MLRPPSLHSVTDVCREQRQNLPACYSSFEQTIRRDFAHVRDLVLDRGDLGKRELETLLSVRCIT